MPHKRCHEPVLVVVAKCKLRVIYLWVHRHVEGENVIVYEVLLDHAVKKWQQARFCHGRVGESDDSVEAT